MGKLPQCRKVKQSAEYMFGSSVERAGGHNDWIRLSFYNIGWDVKSKKHSMERLATEILNMVHRKGIHGLGLTEVHNLRDDSLKEKREIIMQHLLATLNSSAARPASSTHSDGHLVIDDNVTQPVWAGRCDGHYIFLWNTVKLLLTHYEFVSCGIPEHAWRRAQYLQFQRPESPSNPPLHVCHNHNPSSDSAILTDKRRKLIFSCLWATVLTKNAGWTAQPAAVFGGDFNCNWLQWTECFKHEVKTQATRRSIQVCTHQSSDPSTPR